VLPGHIPTRADDADDGGRIRDGSDGKHEWTGMIPIEELPWQLDPAGGRIISANNAAVDADYPHFMSNDWDPGYRARRIGELLDGAAESGDLTAEQFREIQMDGQVPRAALWTPFIEKAEPETADGRAVRDRILSWDGDSRVGSAGTSAFLVTEFRLIRGLFDDELEELARDYVGSTASWQATIALLDDPESPWWDDVTTTERKETQAEVVNRALDAAGSDLRKAFGDPAGWTWGRLHTATFREQTLGTSGIGPLEAYFNKGPVSLAGAAGAIDNTYYRPSTAYPDPNDPDFVPVPATGIFNVTNLPSYRFTIDMTDLDGARIVQTTGQSGNPFDSHYGDLIDEWASGGTIPLPFTEDAVESATVKRLELVP
jgi:penicillin amidase